MGNISNFVGNITIDTLSLIGWIYVSIELLNSWNEWTISISAGIAQPLNEVIMLTGVLVLNMLLFCSLPLVFVNKTIGIPKKTNIDK